MKQMEQFLFFSSPLANEAVCSDEVVSFQWIVGAVQERIFR
jgi:hypothetical protein